MAGEPGHACKRGERCVTDYQGRLSGPFMDRIDMRIEVPAISAADMITVNHGEASEKIAQRVLRAREMQAARTKDAMADPDLAERLKSSRDLPMLRLPPLWLKSSLRQMRPVKNY